MQKIATFQAIVRQLLVKRLSKTLVERVGALKRL